MRPAVAILARIAAATLGNYTATSASGALLAVLFARSGMARADAVVAASIIAILSYLVMLIWAFHARLGRLWVVLAGLTAASVLVVRLIGSGVA